MALAAGSRIGSYEVVAPLGAGGMGEVYRARDTALNRDVALKVLPETLRGDPDRLNRLRREAQMLAALNHTNIAHVYGLEDSAGSTALVMELVEGPTLADLLRNGRLPLEEALAIALQIAGALEAAHEAGIVHRDLKPANIKVRDDGTVKVLDFGLAKALEGDRAGLPDAALSPAMATVTSPALTAMGIILGTAAYMAPEQAKGKIVDKRADIWAFGCVLWEMLTGRALFARDTMPETIAAVIKDTPSLAALPADVPASVRRLLERCLERDPRLRLRDIGEARIVLATPHQPTLTPRARGGRRSAAAAAIAAIALAGITGLVVWRLAPRTAVPVRRLELPATIAGAYSWALSPDGTRIAYQTGGHLYLRAFAALESQDLGPTSVDTANLFWAPDSRTIGFTSGGAVRTIPAAGGTVFTVCRIPASARALDARWIGANIVFSVWRDSMYTVAATGGAPAVWLAIDPAREVDFHQFAPLPGGRLLVHTHLKASDLDVLDLFDGSKRVRVSDTIPGLVAYANPGFVLFERLNTNAGLWAAPFSGNNVDVSRATLIEPGALDFAVAEDGTVVYLLAAARRSSLVWVDRSRAIVPAAGGPIEALGAFELSPDGSRVAYVTGSGVNANLVVRDLQTGADTPLTFNRTEEVNESSALLRPAWSPRGDRILYGTGKVASTEIVVQDLSSGVQPRVLTKGENGRISPDGRTLVYAVDDHGLHKLRRAAILADGTLDTPAPVFAGDDPAVLDFDLSPDGRLLAYSASQADRRAALFITDFPGATGRRLVADGARRARFSHDGRELFYIQGRPDASGRPIGEVMSAMVTPGPGGTLGQAVHLFDDAGPPPFVASVEISPDGRRFLMSQRLPAPPGEGDRLVLLQNWRALLQR